MDLIILLKARFILAFSTVPSRADWGIALGLLVVYGGIALPIGWFSKLLALEWVTSYKTALTTATVALVFPAIVEETLFRVWLLPHPQEATIGSSLWLWSGCCLGLFILAHPLNALVFFPSRKPVFCNPIFLLLAGFLGLVCTISYLQSGSVWPPIGLHWTIVIIWLLGLGGERRMTPIGQ